MSSDDVPVQLVTIWSGHILLLSFVIFCYVLLSMYNLKCVCLIIRGIHVRLVGDARLYFVVSCFVFVLFCFFMFCLVCPFSRFTNPGHPHARRCFTLHDFIFPPFLLLTPGCCYAPVFRGDVWVDVLLGCPWGGVNEAVLGGWPPLRYFLGACSGWASSYLL